MNESGELPNRRSVRLTGYDYASVGAYFVTICVQDRRPLLGHIDEEAKMRPSAAGYLVAGCWQWLAQHYEYVELGNFVLMPDHLHGIIILHDSAQRRKPLGQLIGAFKTVSSKHLQALGNAPGAPIWQRNYYEHIIRDLNDHGRIAEYIRANPQRWLEKHGNS